MKKVKPTGRVFVIHDASKGPPAELVKRDQFIPAALPPTYGYAHRKTGAPKGRTTFDQMLTFGIRTRI